MYWTTAGFVAFAIGCGQPDRVGFGAASSAELAANEALGRFTDGSGRRSMASAASSSELVRQVERGIDYDVVLLAHPSAADALGERVVDRVDLWSNEVVLVAEHTGPVLQDLVGADCLAMGDPEAVPGGAYAKSALEREGMWLLVEDKIRPTVNAPAAVWAVKNGVCGVGAVYRTDAVGAGGLQIGEVLVPSEPVRYPLVLLSEDGRALYDWLQTDAGRAPFTKRGFTRP